MINPLKGEASFESGGKTYVLAYDFNALCMAEEATSIDAPVLIARLETGLSFRLLRGTIWAGLQKHHECHEIEAGEIIAGAEKGAAATAMRAALFSAFPKTEAAPDAPANPPKKPSGARSAGSATGRQKA